MMHWCIALITIICQLDGVKTDDSSHAICAVSIKQLPKFSLEVAPTSLGTF